MIEMLSKRIVAEPAATAAVGNAEASASPEEHGQLKSTHVHALMAAWLAAHGKPLPDWTAVTT
eukprot:SAG25_NODE_7739_length_463_cov_0.593407_1_plen_62_part_10